MGGWIQIKEIKGSGFDRLRAWGRHGGRYTDAELEKLEEQWEVLKKTPGRDAALCVKVLDARFGITGSPHSVRETADLLKMPEGTVGGKIADAAWKLVFTKLPKPQGMTLEEVFAKQDNNGAVTYKQVLSEKQSFVVEDPVPQTFEQFFAHRLKDAPRRPEPAAVTPVIDWVSAWAKVPNWQREYVYQSLLKGHVAKDVEAQEASRQQLHDIAEDSWSISETFLTALRALGFEYDVEGKP